MKWKPVLCILLAAMACIVTNAKPRQQAYLDDRIYWAERAYEMASPVLSNMAAGELQKNFRLETSRIWDGRDPKVAYLECFGRLMAGIAPWLSLSDTEFANEAVSPKYGLTESQMRKQLRTLALQAYANAVDPDSPDYLGWGSGSQTLVDAAYLVESFLRAYDTLWTPLDTLTKARYIKELQGLRHYAPPYSNWLIFVALEEAFLMRVGADYDEYRVHVGLNKIEEWYVGDGWYSDGQAFAFDYYNSFVIQPMYNECIAVVRECKGDSYRLLHRVGPNDGGLRRAQQALERMQKFAVILERFISPEGTFPVFGRSIPYRMAALQPLALLAWKQQLPEELHDGQVRAALTAVMHRMFDLKSNYNEGGYLTIGFVGNAAQTPVDTYTNNGSLYMASLCFMPLGLPASAPFWTAPAEKWTSKKAWEGDDFPKDHKWNINRELYQWK
ncbi:MAG: DUF2264 domain-containing protein [Bacteroidaceae bacterium]|nr:DUF2264 domain-containing protein [Bacteroidaceae bacterium]